MKAIFWRKCKALIGYNFNAIMAMNNSKGIAIEKKNNLTKVITYWLYGNYLIYASKFT